MTPPGAHCFIPRDTNYERLVPPLRGPRGVLVIKRLRPRCCQEFSSSGETDQSSPDVLGMVG
jgi:hypothetical protein